MSNQLSSAIKAYQDAKRKHDAELSPSTYDRLTKALAVLGEAAELEPTGLAPSLNT